MRDAIVNVLREFDEVRNICPIAEALYAALTPAPVSHLRVKPIEWGKTSFNTPEAHTVAGIYRIVGAWSGGWSVNVKNEVLRDSDGRANFATLDDAKAAAQADYERRILSALAAKGPQQ